MQESQWWLSESTDVWDPRAAGQVWQLEVYFWWSTEGPKWRKTGYRRSLPHTLKLKFRSVFGAHTIYIYTFCSGFLIASLISNILCPSPNSFLPFSPHHLVSLGLSHLLITSIFLHHLFSFSGDWAQNILSSKRKGSKLK